MSNSAVSTFSTNNGNNHAGGSFDFVFTLLAGDANRDVVAKDEDLSILLSNYNMSAIFTTGDFNGDNIAKDEDLSALLAHYNLNLQDVWALGDLANNDSLVTDADVIALINHVGMSNPTAADGDLNGDGLINGADLDLIFAHYGFVLRTV